VRSAMEARRTKGPICGIENCRSRSYEEGEDGYLYCQNGHRQAVSSISASFAYTLIKSRVW
jgi:hypothetical protein